VQLRPARFAAASTSSAENRPAYGESVSTTYVAVIFA
jgi:hypothetical protein